ncbi:MAG: EthD family reductase [Planctomycetaceae bacterium]
MLKIVSLLNRKEGTSRDEFYHWARNTHPQLARQLPGIRGYRMNVARLDEPEPAFDAISEMWFDDKAAFEAAFATPPGQRARQDATTHASRRVHVHTEEIVVL